MDPNANVEERIALLLEAREAGFMSQAAFERLGELAGAYASWRASGGFEAPLPARTWLAELLTSDETAELLEAAAEVLEEHLRQDEEGSR